MSALGSLANALLDASRVADLNMHVGSYLLSGSDVRFGSDAACRTGLYFSFGNLICFTPRPGSATSRQCTCSGNTMVRRGDSPDADIVNHAASLTYPCT